jgi:hypothetical protein
VKALIKWEEIWTFINVNGVKVAFTEAQKAQVENKGPGPFFGFGKMEIIRG